MDPKNLGPVIDPAGTPEDLANMNLDQELEDTESGEDGSKA